MALQDSNPVLLDFSLRPDRAIVKRYPCTVYYGYDGYIDPLFVHNGISLYILFFSSYFNVLNLFKFCASALLLDIILMLLYAL